MTREKQPRSLYALLVTPALPLLVFAASGWAGRIHQAPPCGRYSAPQILARAQPLCRALSPPAAGLRLSADQVVLGGGAPHFWQVQCTDEAGDYIACLGWDADTGELVWVGHRTPIRRESAKLLNRSAAVDAAREWLRVFGASSRWELAGDPKHGKGAWQVSWRSGSRKACLLLDARSGDLLVFSSLIGL